jgi:DNA-binding transcriptional LysR family regulator
MKNMTIRQMKAFESVARNLSFSRAAEDLHLTQPAVSMQIKQMERQTGFPLFHHSGKRIVLTEAGEVVLRHCLVILEDLKVAEKSVANLMVDGAQHLRIGLTTSGGYFFPHLINSFMQGKTKIVLDMTVHTRDQLATLLRRELIDLAVMVYAPNSPAIVADPFAPNPFVLLSAPTHPLAYQHDIPYSRIAHESILVRESGTDTRSAADDMFGSRDSTPRFMEMSGTEAIKQSVMAGMGIGFLSAQAVQSEVRAGLLRVLDVRGFPLKRHWCLVHRADRHLPPAARAFRQFLLTEGNARLVHLTGIESVHKGMDIQRSEHANLSTKTIIAGSASHEVALRTRALLRDDRLPDEHQVQRQNQAFGDDCCADQLPAGSESTHH